jgi:ParB/RepB/Spo0J family partition protein
MTNSFQQVRQAHCIPIPLEKLIAHPDNPNRMSKINLAKLVRNIEQTERYEPIIVRPHPQRKGCFQIINGEHRCKALAKLGYKEANSIVWDVNDEQTDILLATLNRLAGTDQLDKKLALLTRLNKKIKADELAKLLPATAKQIERLVNLKMPKQPVNICPQSFANPMVFFLNDNQQQIIESAIFLVAEPQTKMTKAAKRGAALTHIAQYYLDNFSGAKR